MNTRNRLVAKSALGMLQTEFVADRSNTATVTRSGEIQMQLYHSFTAAREHWLAFEAEADHYAFQRYVWLHSWYETVGRSEGVQPCIVKITHAEAGTLMVLPLGIIRRLSMRCLAWMGGDLSDYLGPLLCREFERHIDSTQFAWLWAHLTTLLPPHDAVLLERQPALIGNQANPFVSLPCQCHPSRAHQVRLQGGFEDFLAKTRSAKTLSTERRKRRKLAALGPVEFLVPQTPADIERVLQALLRQKSEAYQQLGVRDLFADTRWREFIRRLSEHHIQDGFVRLMALTVNGKIVATHWGVLHKHRFYYLLPAYERGDVVGLSPGNALLHEMLRWCFDNGVSMCDFTVGDEGYKAHWSDVDMRLFEHTTAVSPRARLLLLAPRITRSLKTIVKSNPRLLSGVLKLRATSGSVLRRRVK